MCSILTSAAKLRQSFFLNSNSARCPQLYWNLFSNMESLNKLNFAIWLVFFYRSSMCPDSISIFSFRKYICLTNVSVMDFLKLPKYSCGSSSMCIFLRNVNKTGSMTRPPFIKMYESTMSNNRISWRWMVVSSICDPAVISDVSNKILPVFSLISWISMP